MKRGKGSPDGCRKERAEVMALMESQTDYSWRTLLNMTVEREERAPGNLAVSMSKEDLEAVSDAEILYMLAVLLYGELPRTRSAAIDLQEDTRIVQRIYTCYLRAYELGHPRVARSLAIVVRKGEGCIADPTRAHQILEHAALVRGEAIPLVELGIWYYNDEAERPRNLTKAAFYFHMWRILTNSGRDYYMLDYIRDRDITASVPWGCWTPENNRWVFRARPSSFVFDEIQTTVRVHARKSTLLSLLPKGILFMVLAYVCTKRPF